MANTLICGEIGAGKSYTALQDFILPALRAGRSVYTNLDFGDKKGEEFLASCRLSLYLKKDCRLLLHVADFSSLKEYLILNDFDGETLRVEKGSLILIDECQMIFDYMGVNRIDPRIYHFFAYARHFGLDLVFLTQNVDLLNKFITGLCNQYVDITGMKQTSQFFKNKYVIEYYARRFGPLLDKRIRTYKKEIFALYRSYVESRADILQQWLPSGWWKAALPLVMAVVLALIVVRMLAGGNHLYFMR